MLRRTLLVAAEFEKTTKVRPLLARPGMSPRGGRSEGQRELFYQKSVVRRTNDANRLVARGRYAQLLTNFAPTEEMEALRDDLRVDDHRRVRWTCCKCGQHMVRSVKAATHYGCLAVCSRCRPVAVATTVPTDAPRRAAEVLKPAERPVEAAADDAPVPAHSGASMTFKCAKCACSFTEAVRARTNASGLLTAQQARDYFGNCPRCRFQVATASRRSFLDTLAASSYS